jgi:hypothetical protein
MTTADFHPTPIITARLVLSDEMLKWVHGQLDGMRLPDLPTEKRTQLATSCWHIAIEHSQAIVVLVHEGLYGSALAMMRIAFEAQVRGMWLMQAATEDDVDRAGRDQFPRDFFGQIVADLEKPGRLKQRTFSFLKGEAWSHLCSLTHTGYQQIGARLTSAGLGYNYTDAEILGALGSADALGLAALVSFARLTNDEALEKAGLERLIRCGQFAHTEWTDQTRRSV